MKKITLLLSCLSLLLFACTPGDTPEPNPNPNNPNNPNNPATPFYATFNFNGTNYNLKGGKDDAQFGPDFYAVGGWQNNANAIRPGIKFSLFFEHEPSHEEVMALAGKTYSTRPDSSIDARLVFSPSLGSDSWFSTTDDAGNFFKVDSVIYSHVGQYISAQVDVYIIKGSCQMKMSHGSTGEVAELKDCNFRTLIARIK